MASDVQICNMALRWAGANSIAALDEKNSQAAKDCSLFYTSLRDTALRDYPWNFAQKRREMTSFEIPDAYVGRYEYGYVLPSDCLKPRKVFESEGSDSQNFKLMRAPTGERMLLTNVQTAVLEYTMLVTDSTWFDSEFVQSLALLIASTLARTLKKNEALAAQLLERYSLMLPSAEASNANEDNPEAEDDVPWLNSRYS